MRHKRGETRAQGVHESTLSTHEGAGVFSGRCGTLAERARHSTRRTALCARGRPPAHRKQRTHGGQQA